MADYVITYDPGHEQIPPDAHCSICDDRTTPPDCIVNREPGGYRWYAHDACMAAIMARKLDVSFPGSEPVEWNAEHKQLWERAQTAGWEVVQIGAAWVLLDPQVTPRAQTDKARFVTTEAFMQYALANTRVLDILRDELAPQER